MGSKKSSWVESSGVPGWGGSQAGPGASGSGGRARGLLADDAWGAAGTPNPAVQVILRVAPGDGPEAAAKEAPPLRCQMSQVDRATSLCSL